MDGMTETKIQPTNITKPMQLLAAWLVGLLAIDSCFLIAATRMPDGSIEVMALTWAAILNVPIFLGALFLLQTKFRPELQEDLYYSTYINQKTNQTVSIARDDQRLAIVLGRIDRIETSLEERTLKLEKTQVHPSTADIKFGINKHFSDKKELSDSLLSFGVIEHSWFGGVKPPEKRVVSISNNISAEKRTIALSLVSKLGFHHYNIFDQNIEDIEEDVLIGSYGPGDKEIPRIAD